MTLMFITGFLLTFVVNKSWSFRELSVRKFPLMRYFFCYLLGYLLNLLLLRLGTIRLGFDHRLVQAVTIVVVGISLFASIRLLVFAAASKVK